MSEPTEKNYVTHDVINPRGVVCVYRDSWWWCIDGDPSKALFYKVGRKGHGSPQCNMNKTVAELVGSNLGHDKRAQLIQIPMAFVPWEE